MLLAGIRETLDDSRRKGPQRSLGSEKLQQTRNYHDTLIEVADDCPATEAQVPHARGAEKTKAVVEYELLIQHPYTYNEEHIAFQVYAPLHNSPNATWPTERQKFVSKRHPH